MRLGEFIKDKDGNYRGVLQAYGLPETSVIMQPKTSAMGQPYYEIVGDPLNTGFDGGVAFPKQKGDLQYLSVTLESPLFPMPIHAGLFKDKTSVELYNLVWDRPKPQPALTADATASLEQQEQPELPIGAQQKEPEAKKPPTKATNRSRQLNVSP